MKSRAKKDSSKLPNTIWIMWQEKEEWRRLAEEHSRMTEELESQVPAPSSQHLDVPSPSKETLALSQELATARQGAHQNVSLQVMPALQYNRWPQTCSNACQFERNV